MALSVVFGIGQLRASESAPAVLTAMERVADWQLANPSRHPATDWTVGAGDAGFMALAGISGNPKYRGAMLAAGEAIQWQVGQRVFDADDYCIGQTYAELNLLYRDPKMLGPLQAHLDKIMAAQPEAGDLNFSLPKARDRWSWCDSLFMGPPVWMRVYAATDNTNYLNFAVTNWWRTADYLYDKQEHLFYRDSTYFGKREANGKKVFWSRGNGWVMAGLVRLLQYLPMNHPDRPRFEQMFKDMAEKVAACQQGDGLWRASLLDPDSYPLKETSGSGFYTYALAWGVNQGLLEKNDYQPAIEKAWDALNACVNSDGKLTHVQPVGVDPKAFNQNSTEIYGVGAYLLAGSEIYRMAILQGTPFAIVKVTNPSGVRRGDEKVEISVSQLGFVPTRPLDLRAAVMDGVSSRITDSQIYAGKDGVPKLSLRVALAPGEMRQYFVMHESSLPAVPPPVAEVEAHPTAPRDSKPLVVNITVEK
jgi:unsaturated rhamnogalacturonyl hydrolase